MKLIAGLVALSLGIADVNAQTATPGSCSAQSGPRTVPLVELYTSEGCSSCPPADRWLSQRFASEDANFLAFHVDYWDDIGWPDRFASPRFSARQRMRVSAAGERTVYTPQVMVGDAVRTSWSRSGEWDRILQQSRVPAGAAISLRLDRTAAGWQAAVGAAPVAGAASADGAQLWLAQYVDGETTQVRAGENRGETLAHDRVVRELFGPWNLDSKAQSRQQPLEIEGGDWGLTAFVQTDSGEILQSVNLHASDCVAGAAAG